MLQLRLFRLLRSLSLCFFVSILILFQLVTNANSAQVTLAWDPNTDQDLAGYRVYYGLLSDQYSYSVDVGNQASYTLPCCCIKFGAQIRQTFGNEGATVKSMSSAELSKW
jgi:hypothetical protein